MAYIQHPGVMSASDDIQEQYKARVAALERYTARLTALMERHHSGLRQQAPEGVCHEAPFDALGWGDAELRVCLTDKMTRHRRPGSPLPALGAISAHTIFGDHGPSVQPQ